MQLQVSTSISPALRGNCPFGGVFATAFLPLLALTVLGLVQCKPQKCPHRFQRVLTQLSTVACGPWPTGQLHKVPEPLEKCFFFHGDN